MKIYFVSLKNGKCKLNMLLLTLFVFFVMIFSVFFNVDLINDVYAQTSAISKKRIIVIDAGHGGEDCGAIGDGNIYEKNLNFQISMKLGEYLSNNGYEVVYTRTEDKLLYKEDENIKGMRKIYDLKNRVAIANSYENALFISIHMNSYGAASCSGLQVYYSPESDGSRNLASSIQGSVVSTLQPTNKRQIKAGKDIYILENSVNNAVLIECGFISNPEECKKLLEKEYQKELSFAIVCGIINYEKNIAG